MVLGEEESVLIREVSLFQGCPYRGVPMYSSIQVSLLRIFGVCVCVCVYNWHAFPVSRFHFQI